MIETSNDISYQQDANNIMNRIKCIAIIILLLAIHAAYSSAQVVIGDKNKYKIYFEERTVCLTDTIIRVRMAYECSVANGQMKNVDVTFEEMSIEYSSTKSTRTITNHNASVKNVGGISMATSYYKVHKNKSKGGLYEMMEAEAVIDVAHPEWSRLQLRAVSMTQEQQGEYGKNLTNPTLSKDAHWSVLNFSPTTRHLNDTTYTMTPAIEYKKNDKGVMEYSIRLDIQGISRFSISIPDTKMPRLNGVNILETNIYPMAMTGKPKYKSIDEARKAMYDVVMVRALLDTRHPERSQISVDTGSVGFYGMGWHDQVVFLHGMGLM